MKYKVSRDIPKFAQEYNTVSPSELARIILKERHKEITPESVTMWFKRHSEIHSQLAKSIENRPSEEVPKQVPEFLARLITNDFGTVEIINLETLEVAKKLLAHVEIELKGRICK